MLYYNVPVRMPIGAGLPRAVSPIGGMGVCPPPLFFRFFPRFFLYFSPCFSRIFPGIFPLSLIEKLRIQQPRSDNALFEVYYTRLYLLA